MATQTENKTLHKKQAFPLPAASQRIIRMQERYQKGDAFISVQRARYYTQSWKETENKNYSLPIRVALAMKNVYEKMDHYLDPDDRIAGYWTEYFMGVPIDIEKGIYNQVMEAELTKPSMLLFRTKSMGKALGYMIRKKAIKDFLKNQRIVRTMGTQPLNMGLNTMSTRKINPYQINPNDRVELTSQLLPYWKGKTITDKIEKQLMESELYSRDMHDFAVAMPGNTSRQVSMISTVATIASIQGHVILDYEPALKKGLNTIYEEIKHLLQAAKDKEITDPSEIDFLTSLQIAVEGVMIFTKRLVQRIESELQQTNDLERRAQLNRMLTICQKVPLNPASSFEEAVQSLWTIKTAVELAHPINLHCFGRMDQILFPYYKKDLDQGSITREYARELLEELLLKIMSQNVRPESNMLSNFYHRFLGSSPVTIGGLTPEGKDGTNDLTYLFLEAANNSRAITNVSVRVHKKTPDELLLKVAEYLNQGTSSFSLFNDEINIKAMEERGFKTKHARDYAIMGCVEATCPGKTGSMSANAILLARLLDVTLRNGDSAILAGIIKNEGLKTGDPDSFESFDDLLEALYKQAAFFIHKIVKASNLRDEIYAKHLPAPYISAFMDGCLQTKKDVTKGGAVYDISGISMINSIANMIDSLYAIKKLVYEQKKTTIKEYLEAVDNNYVGYEELYEAINQLPGMWGNGNQEVDALAQTVMKRLFSEVFQYKNSKGGPFVVYVISMITHTIDGRLSIASPDGRRAATPYAASCNPFNVERQGVTAALRSIACLPYEDVMGCAINMKFHPSGIGDNPEFRKKWVSLIRTYFDMGGSQLQPTAVSTQMLQEAQKDPDQYRNLIVKVGGYSTYFVDLGKEIQDEIIARTEHN